MRAGDNKPRKFQIFPDNSWQNLNRSQLKVDISWIYVVNLIGNTKHCRCLCKKKIIVFPKWHCSFYRLFLPKNTCWVLLPYFIRDRYSRLSLCVCVCCSLYVYTADFQIVQMLSHMSGSVGSHHLHWERTFQNDRVYIKPPRFFESFRTTLNRYMGVGRKTAHVSMLEYKKSLQRWTH
jgi:hypothetical protein